MSKKDAPKKSKRQLMREQRQQQARRQRLFIIIAVAGVALLLVGLVAIPAIQDATAPVGEFETVTPGSYSNADGLAMGDPNAPVTIEVFEDFKCSACKNFHELIEPQVISEMVEPGTVYYVFRQYPFLDDTSAVKDSDNAASASMCAAEQNRFWDYKAMLFANLDFVPGEFKDNRLIAFADSLSLDMNEFESCFDENTYQDEIDQDRDLGVQYGITGTPSVLVNGENVKPGFVPNFEEIKAAVDAAMQ